MRERTLRNRLRCDSITRPEFRTKYAMKSELFYHRISFRMLVVIWAVAGLGVLVGKGAAEETVTVAEVAAEQRACPGLRKRTPFQRETCGTSFRTAGS